MQMAPACVTAGAIPPNEEEGGIKAKQNKRRLSVRKVTVRAAQASRGELDPKRRNETCQ